MKYLLAFFVTALLTACGGGGGGDFPASPVILSDGNQSVRLDRTEPYAVEIPTTGNRLTIAAGNTVTDLDVSGSNNTVIVEFSSIVDNIQFGGANNSLSTGTTVTVSDFVISGTNAVVSIGAANIVDRLAVIGSNAEVTIEAFSANVPDINLAGSNIVLRIPGGYTQKTTIRNTGANNVILEL
jgi:hypothetical protein